MLQSDWFREKFGHILDDRTLEQKIEDTIREHFLIYGDPEEQEPVGVIYADSEDQIRDWSELPVWML